MTMLWLPRVLFDLSVHLVCVLSALRWDYSLLRLGLMCVQNIARFGGGTPLYFYRLFRNLNLRICNKIGGVGVKVGNSLVAL
ncbi:hypothetical protein IAD21_04894 [Abditibacteriota bacterium]|nr:hypothetical protein IAD21_04894 [Abditibacteriota bacterium]